MPSFHPLKRRQTKFKFCLTVITETRFSLYCPFTLSEFAPADYAMATDLPCDGDGICMLCNKKSPLEETLVCCTCATPWHVPCLSKPLESLPSLSSWECPDCAPSATGNVRVKPAATGVASDLVAAIRKIEANDGLTEKEKAKRRQDLLSKAVPSANENSDRHEKNRGKGEVLDLLDEKFKCAMCMQLPERPVTVSGLIPLCF